MDSPLPFYFESDKGPHEGIVPSCHSLDFLTREFLPFLDWEIRYNSIESHSLEELTVASGHLVYDITFELGDTFIDEMRMSVVGVGPGSFCPIGFSPDSQQSQPDEVGDHRGGCERCHHRGNRAGLRWSR